MVKLSNAEEAWIVAENELRAVKKELADFKQEVSDAAEVYEEMGCPMAWEGFEQFIIPKPDPLVGACNVLGWDFGVAEELRTVLDALGFEIRKKNDD